MQRSLATAKQLTRTLHEFTSFRRIHETFGLKGWSIARVKLPVSNCLFLVLASLWLLVLFPSQTLASERWRVVVVGEVVEGQTLPGNHPAWRQVDRAIEQSLLELDFDLYDKAALNFSFDCDGQDCENRTAADYIAQLPRQARGNGLLVVYGVEVSERERPATIQWRINVPIRLIDLETERLVQRWEGRGEFIDTPSGCDEQCRRSWVAEQSAVTGRDAGAVIGELLADYTRRLTYRIEFHDFAIGELQRITSALRQTPQYRSGDLEELARQGSRREWLHRRQTAVYLYQSPWGAGRLSQEINGILKDTRSSAALTNPEGIRRLVLHRQGLPYRERYLAGFGLPWVLLALILLALFYRRHALILAEHDAGADPRAGLAHFEQLTKKPLPLLGSWRARRQRWQEALRAIDLALAQAEEQAREGDFEAAKGTIASVKPLDPTHPGLLAFEQVLPDRIKAFGLATQAADNLIESPSRAAKQATEAASLDPALEPGLRKLLAEAHERLRRGVVEDQTAQARALADSQQPLKMISTAGLGLHAIRGLAQFDRERHVLAELFEQAAEQISPLQGNAIGTGLLGRVRLLTADEVPLGRGRNAPGGVIALDYKRASRLGQQARFMRDRSGLWLEDAGSSNGTMVDEQLLDGRRRARPNASHQIALGGSKNPPSPGQCRLRASVIGAHASSAIVQVDERMLRLLDPAELSKAWPSLAEDRQRYWVLLCEPVGFAMNDQFLVPVDDPETALFLLDYDQGFHITPTGTDIDPGLRMNGEVVSWRMPLPDGAKLQYNDRPFGLETL